MNPKIEGTDAAYLFVKTVKEHVSFHWPDIRKELSALGDLGSLGFPSDHDYVPSFPGVDDETGIHEFSLALMSIEICHIPPQISEKKIGDIVNSLNNELATLDKMPETPSDHVDTFNTYLDLMDGRGSHSERLTSLEIMPYNLYRKLDIPNRGGWTAPFFSSRFTRTVLKYTGDFWKFFLDSYVPPLH